MAKVAGGFYMLPPAKIYENMSYYIIASANTTITVQPGDGIDGNQNVTNQAIFVSDGATWHRFL